MSGNQLYSCYSPVLQAGGYSWRFGLFLGAIDDETFDRAFCRFKLESELLLDGFKERWIVWIFRDWFFQAAFGRLAIPFKRDVEETRQPSFVDDEEWQFSFEYGAERLRTWSSRRCLSRKHSAFHSIEY